MDALFNLRFRRKAVEPSGRRRSSVSLPASKARRRSSAGLPSAGLAHRRRSSAQLQIGSIQPGLVLHRRGHFTRRKSSGGTACLTPRFAIRRRQAAKHRSIHAQLLGPSLLLASVVQMSEDHEPEDKSAEEYSSLSDTDCSQDEHEQTGMDFETESDKCLTWLAQGLLVGESIQPRPLIRAPRCLRRNSSHLLPAEAVYRSPASYGLYGRYRRTSQVHNMGGLWAGKRSSLAARGSVALYRTSPPCWPDLSVSHTLQGTYYNPQIDTWSGFLSYVEP